MTVSYSIELPAKAGSRRKISEVDMIVFRFSKSQKTYGMETNTIFSDHPGQIEGKITYYNLMSKSCIRMMVKVEEKYRTGKAGLEYVEKPSVTVELRDDGLSDVYFNVGNYIKYGR
ncbi:MAG: hypothetical protein HY518_05410 [Candidatus Aenigmarchaeota archaeon]|nr:hypothetical protein [Candidatus Aenigmarchaeota archaeon]